ncbi:MAG: Asp-tRNA(Asn)/Glu-tRNA(Gln) amidotransferase subunit GatC [Gemmatimonadota bacterium]
MKVSREDVQRVAALARLRLDRDELGRFAEQLSGILGHMDELRMLDLADVPPFDNATEAAAPLRADIPGADPLHRPIASYAPSFRDGFFVVPRLAAQLDDAEGGDGA